MSRGLPWLNKGKTMGFKEWKEILRTNNLAKFKIETYKEGLLVGRLYIGNRRYANTIATSGFWTNLFEPHLRLQIFDYYSHYCLLYNQINGKKNDKL